MKTDNPIAETSSAEVSDNPGPGPESGYSTKKVSHGAIEAENERLWSENEHLTGENEWLRSEVVRLNQRLTDANQTIYSLNRKLDAIFKPESASE